MEGRCVGKNGGEMCRREWRGDGVGENGGRCVGENGGEMCRGEWRGDV